MLKSLKTAVVFFLAVGQSLTASQANAIGPTLPELKAFKKLNQRSAHQLPLWCNIGDIVKFKPETFPDGKVILTALADTDGPLNRILLGDGSELNGSISLQEPPIARPSQTEYPSLIAFMKSKEGILFLRRFSLMIGEKDHRRVLLDAHVKFDALGSDLALSQLNFQISVGLLNRLLVLEDPQNQVTLLYPLGVGGIDPGLITEGRVHILTPLFKNDWFACV